MTTSRRRVPPQPGSERPSAASRSGRGLRVWPRRASRSVMICGDCELTGGPFATAEAEHLAAVHNQLHHRGTPHAQAVPA